MTKVLLRTKHKLVDIITNCDEVIREYYAKRDSDSNPHALSDYHRRLNFWMSRLAIIESNYSVRKTAVKNQLAYMKANKRDKLSTSVKKEILTSKVLLSSEVRELQDNLETIDRILSQISILKSGFEKMAMTISQHISIYTKGY